MKKYLIKYSLHKDVLFLLFTSLFIFMSLFFLIRLTGIELLQYHYSSSSTLKSGPLIDLIYFPILVLSLISIILNSFIIIRNIKSQSLSFTFYNGYKSTLKISFIFIIIFNTSAIIYLSVNKNFNEFIYYTLFFIGSLASLTFLICIIPTCELDIKSKKAVSINHWVYPYLNDKQLKQLRLVEDNGKYNYILSLPNISLSDAGGWFKYYDKFYTLSAFKNYIEAKSCKIDELSKDDLLVIEMLGIK